MKKNLKFNYEILNFQNLYEILYDSTEAYFIFKMCCSILKLEQQFSFYGASKCIFTFMEFYRIFFQICYGF